jgi:hypothetical protein
VTSIRFKISKILNRLRSLGLEQTAAWAAQVDFGEAVDVISGVRQKIHRRLQRRKLAMQHQPPR